jgi:hypothetical protein
MALMLPGPQLLGRDFLDINNLTTVPADAPYPHSSQQTFGYFLLFGLTGLSFLMCGLRLYGISLSKSVGWGTSCCCHAPPLILVPLLTLVLADDRFIVVALVSLLPST